MSIHDDLERAASYLSPQGDDDAAMPATGADRLAASLRNASLELAGLRRFAQRVLAHWPEAGPDDVDIQDAAIDCGLLQLANPSPTQPCGPSCWCTAHFDPADFADGSVRCYRRTRVLTGHTGQPDQSTTETTP